MLNWVMLNNLNQVISILRMGGIVEIFAPYPPLIPQGFPDLKWKMTCNDTPMTLHCF